MCKNFSFLGSHFQAVFEQWLGGEATNKNRTERLLTINTQQQCLRILLSCFRARTSGFRAGDNKWRKEGWKGPAAMSADRCCLRETFGASSVTWKKEGKNSLPRDFERLWTFFTWVRKKVTQESPTKEKILRAWKKLEESASSIQTCGGKERDGSRWKEVQQGGRWLQKTANNVPYEVGAVLKLLKSTPGGC